MPTSIVILHLSYLSCYLKKKSHRILQWNYSDMTEQTYLTGFTLFTNSKKNLKQEYTI